MAFLLNWLQSKPSGPQRKNKPLRSARRAFSQTTLPLISPRRGRRILRREQLFAVVRESLIRGGVLSTSYEFKVLTLDANGDGFLVLVDLALPAVTMPDEYLLEIERWIQSSAKARHGMEVRGVYWRRLAEHDQRGIALKAAVVAQRRVSAQEASPTAIPVPPTHSPDRMQPVAPDEVAAFRQALHAEPGKRYPVQHAKGASEPESHSDFSALSETQYGKL
ncbi:MAG: hypothetical protein R3E94_02680 [Burkholderiaceae bacterium]